MRRFALAVSIVAAYAVSLRAPFTYDDRVEVVGNPTIRSLGEVVAIAGYNVSRPLLIASYALNWALGGLEPFGYHVVSLAIHVTNALLVERLARRWVQASWLVAALWALHPMCTEAVTYTTGRSDALCATAWLVALIAWTSDRPKGALAATAVGFLVKEVAVGIPLALAAARRAPARSWVGFALLTAAAAALRVFSVGLPVAEVDRGAFAHVATQAEAWMHYLRLWIVPAGQSVLHDLPVSDRPWALGVWVGAGAVAVWKGGRLGLAAALWAAWLLPSSAVPLKETMAEHRAYFAGIPVALLVAGWLPRAAWAAVPALFAATVLRNHVWTDEAGLWADASVKNPASADAAYGRAEALRFAGRETEAVGAYRRVLELRPDDPDARVGLGISLAETGDPAAARAQFLAALRRDPRKCAAHNDLAALDVLGGRPREAAEGYASTLRACPDDALAHYNLGVLLLELGRTGDGEAHLRRYLEVAPVGAFAENARARLAGLR